MVVTLDPDKSGRPCDGLQSAVKVRRCREEKTTRLHAKSRCRPLQDIRSVRIRF